MIRVRDSDGSTPIAHVRVRDAANTLAEIGTVRARDAGGLATVFQSFSADISPSEVFGYGYSKGLITITTTYATVVVKGGTPPYSFNWGTAPSPWSIVNPGSQSTAFRRSGVAAGSAYQQTFHCDVTDATGKPVSAGSVVANVENSYQA